MNELPQRVVSKPDKDGIFNVIEWELNSEKQKVKITKRVQQSTSTIRKSKKVIERESWRKFGAELDNKDNTNVTYVSNEDIQLEDPSVDMINPGDKKEEENIFAGVKNSSIVSCRHCGMVGDHWTLKCPYKDTPVDELNEQMGKDKAAKSLEEEKEEGKSSLSNLTMGGGKYVPPSLRGNGATVASSMDNDSENATLRVTNISLDTRDSDLQELFRAFGPISRVYLAKDRETMQSRGFAFINFVYRDDAQRALNELQGFGYDHLILKLEWAKPSNKPAASATQDEGSKGTTYRSGYGKALPQNMNPNAK